MAIIKDLGLAVSIMINGEPVPEYDDPDPPLELDHPRTKVVNKYIESEDEIEYSIRCQVLPGHRYLPNREDNAIEFRLIMDGNTLVTQVLGRRDWGPRGASVTVEGVDSGPDWSMLKRFKFSAVQTYDGADPITTREDMKRAETLGLIRVVVRRSVEDYGEGSYCQPDATNLFLAETALKGHTVSLGTSLSPDTTQPADNRSVPCTTKLVDDEHPYAIFNFKHRSRDDLRHENLLPRTPSADADAGVEDTSDEELA